VWQLTFLVKNLTARVEDLRKRGVRFQRLSQKLGGTRVTDEMLQLRSGRIAVFKDPEGNLCMLFEAKKPVRPKSGSSRRQVAGSRVSRRRKPAAL
jgi:predicted enzyme related to lactoylglutathione lyase